MTNRIKLRHSEHQYKICSEKFKTSMELVSHMAKHHHEEEEEVLNVNFRSTPKFDKDTQISSFVFD